MAFEILSHSIAFIGDQDSLNDSTDNATDTQLQTLAVRKLEQMIYNKSIKIKDIEPVET